MYGVMIPEVSAGSNHVGASEMWTAQVICSAGASARPSGAVPSTTVKVEIIRTSSVATRPRTRIARGGTRDGPFTRFRGIQHLPRGRTVTIVQGSSARTYRLSSVRRFDSCVVREAESRDDSRRSGSGVLVILAGTIVVVGTLSWWLLLRRGQPTSSAGVDCAHRSLIR